MPSYFDEGQGFFVRKPSWHRLEKFILPTYPESWDEARRAAELTWEPVLEPVYAAENAHERYGDLDREYVVYSKIPGFQLVKRSDTGAALTIQTDAYRVITNTDLGNVVDTVMGSDWNEVQKIEGLFTLHDGKLVICLIRNKETTSVSFDPSQHLEYTAVCSRNDGQGGLKVIRTKVRVVCANTWGMAEHASQDGKTSFTIRHTENWDARVAHVREQLLLADQAGKEYYELGEQLSLKKVTVPMRERYLEKFLPIGSDMTDRQKKNRYNEREQVRTILNSPTCEGIDKTAYGLLQASGEWCDHFRRFRSNDTYVTRNLVSWEPQKARAVRLTKEMAGMR